MCFKRFSSFFLKKVRRELLVKTEHTFGSSKSATVRCESRLCFGGQASRVCGFKRFSTVWWSGFEHVGLEGVGFEVFLLDAARVVAACWRRKPSRENFTFKRLLGFVF